SVLGVGGDSGTMIHYCNKMPWNTKNKSIEIIGMDHNYPSLRHVRYDEPSNQFILVADDAGLGQAHGYDHVQVNPYSGDVYYRVYHLGAEPLVPKRKTLGASSFVDLPPGVDAGYQQVDIGTCWWGGAFDGASAQGGYFIYNSGDTSLPGSATDGRVVVFDPVSNTWIFNQRSMSPFNATAGSTMGSVSAYSAVKNVAVYGGCADTPTKSWRMDQHGAVTAMPTAPAGVTVGIQNGNLNCDPTSGNFLVLSGGNLWELNSDGSGTWTKQIGTRQPPANMNPTGGTNGIFSTALPEHGVVAYVQQTSNNGGTFWLYKHDTSPQALYTTTFAATENPISESGNWTNTVTGVWSAPVS